jgi:hypothetical protein
VSAGGRSICALTCDPDAMVPAGMTNCEGRPQPVFATRSPIVFYGCFKGFFIIICNPAPTLCLCLRCLCGLVLRVQII